MSKTVSSRQVVALLFLLICLTKFLSLPSLLTQTAGKSAFFTAFLLFFIDFLVFFLLLCAVKRSNSQNFYQMLTNSLGNLFAKIVCFLYAIYFLFKTLLILLEANQFFSYSFYSNFSPIIFTIILFTFLFYMASKTERTILRAFELLKFPIFVAVLIAILSSLAHTDPINALPLLESGFSPILEAGVKQVFWFGDALFLFVLFGKIELTKRFTKHAVLTFIVSSLLVVLFIFNFYNLFEGTANLQHLAIGDILGTLSGQSALSHAYWLIDFMWSIALIFGMGLYLSAASTFLQFGFLAKNKNASIIALIIVLLVALLWLQFDVRTTVYATSVYFSSFAILMQYVLPAFVLLVIGFVRRKV